MQKYVFPFEKLQVWQLSVDLAEFVLDLLDNFPKNRYLRLVGQMEAAVTSPAQNTAEGKGRQYKKEFVQFLHIAQGSLHAYPVSSQDVGRVILATLQGVPKLPHTAPCRWEVLLARQSQVRCQMLP